MINPVNRVDPVENIPHIKKSASTFIPPLAELRHFVPKL